MKGKKIWHIAALLVTVIGAALVAPDQLPALVGQVLPVVV